MSLWRAKFAVTRYFKGRVAALRLLNNRRLKDDSDYFELYVLVRLARRGNGNVVATGKDSRGRPAFVVAGSPSPSWAKASYIEVKGLAARTGLEVQCAPGAVELDVALVNPAHVNIQADEVPARAVIAAFECKALKGKIKTTHANEIIGKAHRVWTLPLKLIKNGKATAHRYSAAGLNGATAGLDLVLAASGIGLADNLAEIDASIRKLLDVLP